MRSVVDIPSMIPAVGTVAGHPQERTYPQVYLHRRRHFLGGGIGEKSRTLLLCALDSTTEEKKSDWRTEKEEN